MNIYIGFYRIQTMCLNNLYELYDAFSRGGEVSFPMRENYTDKYCTLKPQKSPSTHRISLQTSPTHNSKYQVPSRVSLNNLFLNVHKELFDVFIDIFIKE